MSLVNVITTGVVTAFITLNVFYNGTELPQSIFGELLAIPVTTQVLGPLSYFDMTNTLPNGRDRGAGWHFGGSAFVGDETLYLNALGHWTNFTNTFKDHLSLTILTFTPVLNPQIQAGRARGGNAINPPLGGYAAVLATEQYAPGVMAIPAEVEQGTTLLYSQYAVIVIILSEVLTHLVISFILGYLHRLAFHSS